MRDANCLQAAARPMDLLDMGPPIAELAGAAVDLQQLAWLRRMQHFGLLAVTPSPLKVCVLSWVHAADAADCIFLIFCPACEWLARCCTSKQPHACARSSCAEVYLHRHNAVHFIMFVA